MRHELNFHIMINLDFGGYALSREQMKNVTGGSATDEDCNFKMCGQTEGRPGDCPISECHCQDLGDGSYLCATGA